MQRTHRQPKFTRSSSLVRTAYINVLTNKQMQ